MFFVPNRLSSRIENKMRQHLHLIIRCGRRRQKTVYLILRYQVGRLGPCRYQKHLIEIINLSSSSVTQQFKFNDEITSKVVSRHWPGTDARCPPVKIKNNEKLFGIIRYGTACQRFTTSGDVRAVDVANERLIR